MRSTPPHYPAGGLRVKHRSRCSAAGVPYRSRVMATTAREQVQDSASQWWISLNVTRTRVSLLGFHLSVITFLVGLL